MENLLKEIQEKLDAFVKDAEAQVEKGNKAAGTRARKTSLELTKLCKERPDRQKTAIFVQIYIGRGLGQYQRLCMPDDSSYDKTPCRACLVFPAGKHSVRPCTGRRPEQSPESFRLRGIHRCTGRTGKALPAEPVGQGVRGLLHRHVPHPSGIAASRRRRAGFRRTIPCLHPKSGNGYRPGRRTLRPGTVRPGCLLLPTHRQVCRGQTPTGRLRLPQSLQPVRQRGL